jgi:molecular chaperone DnaK (HSP70)
MSEDSIDDLIETLNSIRQHEFPEISKELLEDIVRIERETLEDRELTQDRISEIVESHLSE